MIILVYEGIFEAQGGEADLEEPLIVKDDSTVETICNKLHRDFVRNSICKSQGTKC